MFNCVKFASPSVQLQDLIFGWEFKTAGNIRHKICSYVTRHKMGLTCPTSSTIFDGMLQGTLKVSVG